MKKQGYPQNSSRNQVDTKSIYFRLFSNKFYFSRILIQDLTTKTSDKMTNELSIQFFTKNITTRIIFNKRTRGDTLHKRISATNKIIVFQVYYTAI